VGVVASLGSARRQAQVEAQTQPPPSPVVATIGDRVLSLEELERYWREHDPASFARLQQQLYQARQRALESLIGDHLLEREARKRGLSVDGWLAEELPRDVEAVTEAEILDTYRRSSAVARGLTIEQARPAIIGYLRQKKRLEARQRVVDALRKAAAPEIVVLLPVPRHTVSVSADDPARGPAQAPVTVVVFADFECPYCRRAMPVLQRLLAKYPDQVRLVWKDFPLPTHPMAALAAEAAQCAHEQGRFWSYHDALVADPGSLQPEQLRRRAMDVGLDPAAFDRCIESHRYRPRVAASLQQGRSLGVDATPTVFINGRVVAGLVPFDTYEGLVLEELANLRVRRP